jgi:hypothetical protein
MVKPEQVDEDDAHLNIRMIFPVTETMEEQIKDYWHDQRLNSKSAALRALVQSGLDAWAKKRSK